MVVNRWTVILNQEEEAEEVSLWWWENFNFDYHGHLSFSLILLGSFFFIRRMKQPATNSRNSSRLHCRMHPLTTSTPSLEVVSLEYPMLCIELALDWDYFCSFWSPLLQTIRLFWWWVSFEYPFVSLSFVHSWNSLFVSVFVMRILFVWECFESHVFEIILWSGWYFQNWIVWFYNICSKAPSMPQFMRGCAFITISWGLKMCHSVGRQRTLSTVFCIRNRFRISSLWNLWII